MSAQRLGAAALSLLVLPLLAGCSSYFRDRASDYRTAQEAPPLVLPEGQESRPIKALYPIPPGKAVQFDPDKKFVAPKPKPLAELPATAPMVAESGDAGWPRAQLGQDGNGYATVSISGDANAIWDQLAVALQAGKIKVDDRDQRVGVYYLSLRDEAGKTASYQLRLSRGQTAYSLSLQQDDETLASQAQTQSLFEAIVNNWPQSSGDPNAKARPAVHR